MHWLLPTNEVFGKPLLSRSLRAGVLRKLAKDGSGCCRSPRRSVTTIPKHVMVRQIMALFDEYRSKENAKHALRAQKENARQGFWNGSLPPIGYPVVAAETRAAKVKKKLGIDPQHADTVRQLPPGSPSAAGSAGRARGERGPHHGVQEQVAPNLGGDLWLWRKTGYPWACRTRFAVAEGVGFEPTVPLRARRFSRPVP